MQEARKDDKMIWDGNNGDLNDSNDVFDVNGIHF